MPSHQDFENVDLVSLNPLASPAIITKDPTGTRITFSWGQDVYVTDKPKAVRKYFGIPEPRFDLWALILKLTGVTAYRLRKAREWGEAKAKDPVLNHMIQVRTPLRAPWLPAKQPITPPKAK